MKCSQLNNKGVSLIASGEYLEAIKVLSSALRCCSKGKLKNKQQKRNECYRGKKSDSKIFHLDSWMSGGKRLTEEYSIKNNKNSDNTLSVQTFTIPHERTNNQPQQEFIPVAITFNLALAHHLYGLNKKKSKKALQTAIQMYQFVLDYQLKSDVSLSTCVGFVMTILNNVAHAHSILGHQETSDYFFEKLLSILDCLDMCYREDEEKVYTFSQFRQNTNYLVQRKLQ